MDGNITAIPSSTVETSGGEGSNTTEAPDGSREIFEKAFPQYLAMGMTYDEFYRKDHTLVIAYRSAYKTRKKEENEKLWLMGAYVYQAICRAAPLLIPFNNNPKPEDYLKEPFPLYDDETDNAGTKVVDNPGLAYMQAQMMKINNKFGK